MVASAKTKMGGGQSFYSEVVREKGNVCVGAALASEEEEKRHSTLGNQRGEEWITTPSWGGGGLNFLLVGCKDRSEQSASQAGRNLEVGVKRGKA